MKFFGACSSSPVRSRGREIDRAIEVALIEPLSDDFDIKQGLRDVVQAVFG